MKRTSKKQMYKTNFIKQFNNEMRDTIWTEEGQEIWIDEYAEAHYRERRKDIKNNADALLYGMIDCRKYCEKIREECRK